MTTTTTDTATEAQILADFRNFGFNAALIPAGERTDPAEFLCLILAAGFHQDTYRNVLTDILRPGVTTLEISREEDGTIWLRHITSVPAIKLAPVLLSEGYVGMCTGHCGLIEGSAAFETPDGWLFCIACAAHIAECTDPDCDHI
jgi:hypothetical protein